MNSLTDTIKELTQSLVETEESRSSPRRLSFIYNAINCMQEHEEIVWYGLLADALTKDPGLHWIDDLEKLNLSEERISGFFLEIEKMMHHLDYNPTAQKSVFLFIEAKRTFELWWPHNVELSPHMLLKVSYSLFSLYEKPQLSSFLTVTSKALSKTEEEILSLFFLYSKNCSAALPIKPFVRELACLEARLDWLALFLQCCGRDTLREPSLFLSFKSALEEAFTSKELGVHTFTYKVTKRYQQIHQAEHLNLLLLGSKSELSLPALSFKAMNLAHHIVSTEPRTISVKSVFVKSPLFTHIKLHHNAISGDSYILAKYQTPSLINPSRMTTSRIYLRLPSNFTEKSTSVYIKNSRRCQDLIELRHGAEIHGQLTGHRGIWPLLSTGVYEKLNGNKIFIFMPAADSFRSMIMLHSQLSFTETLLIALDLACGLEHLHAHQLIHGKIDLASALLSGDTCEEKRAGWANFEFTRKAQPDLFKNGSYGSRRYTAPEIFGIEGTCIDPYKADIWAFGQLLLSLYTLSEQVPWTSAIDDASVNIDQFIARHKDVVIDPQDALLQKTTGYSPQEEFELLMYSMLSIRATKRPCATQVRERIGEIKQKAYFEPING